MGFTLEELIMADSTPKNEVRFSKSARVNNVKVVKNTSLLEALAKGGSVTSHTTEDGKVKIKIMVKKQDLNKMLDTMSNGNNDVNDSSRSTSSLPGKSSSKSIERRLYELMKIKKAKQANMENQSINWRPALQSIPEE